MSNFDFSALMRRVADELGYTLFLDFGTLDARHNPYRKINKNEIVTPIAGVFRLNSTPLTALRTPFIAVATATLDIPTPTDLAEDVRANLNNLAVKLNATAEKYQQGDTTYTVSYNAETCLVGSKRKDVPLYGGEIVPITQVITFTIVELGVSAFDYVVMLDGIDIPILSLQETRTAASETAPDARAVGAVSITQELYGLTITTPAVYNTIGDLLGEIVKQGNGNRAHAVEVIVDGESNVYMMTVGTSGATVQPPNNVGYNLSLAEIAPDVAKFNGLWRAITMSGPLVSYNLSDGVIFWGDGTADRVKGSVSHTYLDEESTHTAYAMSYADTSRWGNIKNGDTLRGKRIAPASQIVAASSLPAVCVKMDSGDTLGISGNRLTMTVDGRGYTVDTPDTVLGYALSKAFTSLLRGKVTDVNTDLLLYDRWAVGEED